MRTTWDAAWMGDNVGKYPEVRLRRMTVDNVN